MNAVVHWTVPADHPFFAGHFPGHPVVPGVALLDAVVRVVGAGSGIPLDVCDISAAKFLSPAGPGDRLEIRYTVSEDRTIRFEIRAVTRLIASGSIISRPVA